MNKQLPKKLQAKSFSVKEAQSLGLTKLILSRMAKKGELVRLSRGVYQHRDLERYDNETLYRMATIRCGKPSAICLLSALEYYHLTDEIPEKIYILVPNEKRIVAENIKLVRSRNPQWNIGINKLDKYWITSIERTIVESLTQSRVINKQLGLSALKNAIRKKVVKLSDVYDMANKMGLLKRVYPYLETLSV